MIIKGKDNFKGKKNKRLQASDPTNNEGTAAWQDSRETHGNGRVNKPSLQRVLDAKDWVDNGSKL